MAGTHSTDPSGRPKRNWRYKESRQLQKVLGMRVSKADHAVVNWYIKQIKSSVSDQLDPAVRALIATARAHLADRELAGDETAAEVALTLASA